MDNELTILPEDELKHDKDYEVVVGEDAVAYDGDEDIRLGEAYEFSFTTEH